VALFVMNLHIMRHIHPKIERRNALQHKRSMIGIVSRLHRQIAAAQILEQRVAPRLHRLLQISASFDLPSLWMSSAIIGIKNRDALRQLALVRLRVSIRSKQSLFFSAPQDEAHTAPRSLAKSQIG